jgi:hypothetical protein
MWRKLLQDERGSGQHRPVVFDDDDPELDAWNAYLASVHQNDKSAPDEHST